MTETTPKTLHPLIVKRSPEHSEDYDERKLYASIYASCLAARSPVGAAEITADRVCRDILPWLLNHPEITSADIRGQAAAHLGVYHPDAAFLYKHHRLMI